MSRTDTTPFEAIALTLGAMLLLATAAVAANTSPTSLAEAAPHAAAPPDPGVVVSQR